MKDIRIIIARGAIFFLAAWLITACGNGDSEMATPALSAALTQLAATATAQSPTVTDVEATPQVTVHATAVDLVIGPLNARALTPSAQMNLAQANGLAWMSSAQALALSTESDVQFFNVWLPEMLSKVNAPQPRLMVASPSQDLVAWSGADKQVYLWDQTRNQMIFSFSSGKEQVTGLAFSPADNQLAISTYDQILSIWDSTSGQKLREWSLPYWLENLAFSPDGEQVAGADLVSFAVHILDADTGEEVHSLSWEASASPVLYGAYLSPDWKRLAWVSRAAVQLMIVPGGEYGPMLNHEDFISAVAWSPDGRLLASAAAGMMNGDFHPLVYLWEVETGQVLKTLIQEGAVTGLSFSPNGEQLAILDGSGTLRVWAVAP